MKKVRQFFDALVDEHGMDPRSANWSGLESQRSRLAVFCTYIPLSNCSILDIGCGQAELYAYLRSNRIPFSSYQGWDISPRMIATARTRFPELCDGLVERDLFCESGLVGTHDWVLCSGSLNFSYDQQSFETAVRIMYRLALKGVAFNVMSTYADFMNDKYYYAAPEHTFSFCRALTPWVDLIHSYMPHDFTVIMKRERDVPRR